MATPSETQFRYTMFQFKMFEQNWGGLVVPQVLHKIINITTFNVPNSETQKRNKKFKSNAKRSRKCHLSGTGVARNYQPQKKSVPNSERSRV